MSDNPTSVRRKTKSILDELDAFVPTRDITGIIDTRANHIIQSAINLVQMMREHYTPEQAEELERKLLVSIRAQEPEKFSRALDRAIQKN